MELGDSDGQLGPSLRGH